MIIYSQCLTKIFSFTNFEGVFVNSVSSRLRMTRKEMEAKRRDEEDIKKTSTKRHNTGEWR
jgi:hypothetical protein